MSLSTEGGAVHEFMEHKHKRASNCIAWRVVISMDGAVATAARLATMVWCATYVVCVCVRCHATKTLQPKTTTYTEHLSVDVAKCCSRLEWPWAASHTSVAMSARGARAPLSRHAHADHLTRATPWPIDIVLGACPRRLLESSSSLQALESTKYTCLEWTSRNMVPPRTSKHPGPFGKKRPSIATCCPPVRTVLNVFSKKLISDASAPAAVWADA